MCDMSSNKSFVYNLRSSNNYVSFSAEESNTEALNSNTDDVQRDANSLGVLTPSDVQPRESEDMINVSSSWFFELSQENENLKEANKELVKKINKQECKSANKEGKGKVSELLDQLVNRERTQDCQSVNNMKNLKQDKSIGNAALKKKLMVAKRNADRLHCILPACRSRVATKNKLLRKMEKHIKHLWNFLIEFGNSIASVDLLLPEQKSALLKTCEEYLSFKILQNKSETDILKAINNLSSTSLPGEKITVSKTSSNENIVAFENSPPIFISPTNEASSEELSPAKISNTACHDLSALDKPQDNKQSGQLTCPSLPSGQTETSFGWNTLGSDFPMDVLDSDVDKNTLVVDNSACKEIPLQDNNTKLMDLTHEHSSPEMASATVPSSPEVLSRSKEKRKSLRSSTPEITKNTCTENPISFEMVVDTSKTSTIQSLNRDTYPKRNKSSICTSTPRILDFPQDKLSSASPNLTCIKRVLNNENTESLEEKSFISKLNTSHNSLNDSNTSKKLNNTSFNSDTKSITVENHNDPIEPQIELCTVTADKYKDGSVKIGFNLAKTCTITLNPKNLNISCFFKQTEEDPQCHSPILNKVQPSPILHSNNLIDDGQGKQLSFNDNQFSDSNPKNKIPSTYITKEFPDVDLVTDINLPTNEGLSRDELTPNLNNIKVTPLLSTDKNDLENINAQNNMDDLHATNAEININDLDVDHQTDQLENSSNCDVGPPESDCSLTVVNLVNQTLNAKKCNKLSSSNSDVEIISEDACQKKMKVSSSGSEVDDLPSKLVESALEVVKECQLNILERKNKNGKTQKLKHSKRLQNSENSLKSGSNRVNRRNSKKKQKAKSSNTVTSTKIRKLRSFKQNALKDPETDLSALESLHEISSSNSSELVRKNKFYKKLDSDENSNDAPISFEDILTKHMKEIESKQNTAISMKIQSNVGITTSANPVSSNVQEEFNSSTRHSEEPTNNDDPYALFGKILPESDVSLHSMSNELDESDKNLSKSFPSLISKHCANEEMNEDHCSKSLDASYEVMDNSAPLCEDQITPTPHTFDNLMSNLNKRDKLKDNLSAMSEDTHSSKVVVNKDNGSLDERDVINIKNGNPSTLKDLNSSPSVTENIDDDDLDKSITDSISSESTSKEVDIPFPSIEAGQSLMNNMKSSPKAVHVNQYNAALEEEHTNSRNNEYESDDAEDLVVSNNEPVSFENILEKHVEKSNQSILKSPIFSYVSASVNVRDAALHKDNTELTNSKSNLKNTKMSVVAGKVPSSFEDILTLYMGKEGQNKFKAATNSTRIPENNLNKGNLTISAAVVENNIVSDKGPMSFEEILLKHMKESGLMKKKPTSPNFTELKRNKQNASFEEILSAHTEDVKLLDKNRKKPNTKELGINNSTNDTYLDLNTNNVDTQETVQDLINSSDSEDLTIMEDSVIDSSDSENLTILEDPSLNKQSVISHTASDSEEFNNVIHNKDEHTKIENQVKSVNSKPTISKPPIWVKGGKVFKTKDSAIETFDKPKRKCVRKTNLTNVEESGAIHKEELFDMQKKKQGKNIITDYFYKNANKNLSSKVPEISKTVNSSLSSNKLDSGSEEISMQVNSSDSSFHEEKSGFKAKRRMSPRKRKLSKESESNVGKLKYEKQGQKKWKSTRDVKWEDNKKIKLKDCSVILESIDTSSYGGDSEQDNSYNISMDVKRTSKRNKNFVAMSNKTMAETHPNIMLQMDNNISEADTLLNKSIHLERHKNENSLESEETNRNTFFCNNSKTYSKIGKQIIKKSENSISTPIFPGSKAKSVEDYFKFIKVMKLDDQNFKPNAHSLKVILSNQEIFPDIAELLNSVVKYLSPSKENLVLKFVENAKVPALITEDEDCIVTALLMIESEKKTHLEGILKVTLDILQRFVTTKPFSCYGLASLCRVATEISKRKGDNLTPLTICTNFLKIKHQFAPYLIASIAGIWRELFQVEDGLSDEDFIFHSSIAYGAKKKTNMPESDFNASMKIISEYSNSRNVLNVKKSISLLMNIIKISCCEEKFTHIHKLTSALVIFSVHEDWNWTRENVLNLYVEPNLDKFGTESINVKAFDVFCNLYVDIFLENPNLKPQEQVLIKFFKKDAVSKGFIGIQESAAKALAKLSYKKNIQIPKIVLNWFEKNQNNPIVVAIKKYLKNKGTHQ